MSEANILARALCVAVRQGEISPAEARRVISWVPWEDQRRDCLARLAAVAEAVIQQDSAI